MSESWHTIWSISGFIVYYLTMVAGMLIIPLGIPGQFVIAIATLAVTLMAGRSCMPWWVVILLFGLALTAEGLEALAGYFGARGAKGSVWSALGAIGGGFAGAIVGAPFGFIAGSLMGAFMGTFAGAYLVEYWRTRKVDSSTRVASAALVGRLLGSVIKTGIALMMIVIVTAVLVL